MPCVAPSGLHSTPQPTKLRIQSSKLPLHPPLPLSLFPEVSCPIKTKKQTKEAFQSCACQTTPPLFDPRLFASAHGTLPHQTRAFSSSISRDSSPLFAHSLTAMTPTGGILSCEQSSPQSDHKLRSILGCNFLICLFVLLLFLCESLAAQDQWSGELRAETRIDGNVRICCPGENANSYLN